MLNNPFMNIYTNVQTMLQSIIHAQYTISKETLPEPTSPTSDHKLEYDYENRPSNSCCGRHNTIRHGQLSLEVIKFTIGQTLYWLEELNPTMLRL